MDFINFIKFIYNLLPNFDKSVDLKVWVALFITVCIFELLLEDKMTLIFYC